MQKTSEKEYKAIQPQCLQVLRDYGVYISAKISETPQKFKTW